MELDIERVELNVISVPVGMLFPLVFGKFVKTNLLGTSFGFQDISTT